MRALQHVTFVIILAFDVQHDDLAVDRVGVDGAAILSLVGPLDVANLQVPLLDVRSDHAEPEVVHDASVFVRQRYRLVVEPRHLQLSRRSTCF